MEDNWSEKLSKLINEELRISALTDLKERFESLPKNEATVVAQQLQLPILFDCLNASDPNEVELACEVLSLCMSHLSLGDTTNRYNTFLERALKHPFPSVKLMVLKEISRNASNDDVLVDLSKHFPLLTLIVKCIGDQDLSVAKLAGDIITKIGLTEFGIKQLLIPDVAKVIHELAAASEVIRLRVFEVLINVSSESEAAQKLLESAGFFDIILRELNSNDILLRINIIELLTQYVTQKHGYMYLESHGFIEKLVNLLDDDSDPIAQQLSEPAILKFFGHMVTGRPEEAITTYTKVIDRIFRNLESENMTIYGVSLDTFGYIAATDKGKVALEATAGSKLEQAISSVVNGLGSLPTELKIRALKVIENLLRIDDITTRVSSITFKWFKLMGQNFIDKIVSYAKNPFGEIRLAGFGVLHSLATQQWGQEIIQQFPGLVEFLLDRQVETTKECKEMKYEIVRVLSESTVFDSPTLLRLKTFVKEGPFYVRAVTEVAIEGNN